jgi:hypothetical protein
MKPSLINHLSKLAYRGNQLTKKANPILRAVGAVGQSLKGLGTKALTAVKPTPMGALNMGVGAMSANTQFKQYKSGFKAQAD